MHNSQLKHAWKSTSGQAVLLVILLLAHACVSAPASAQSQSKEAFITLVYGASPEYAIGAQVLFQALIESRSILNQNGEIVRDMVAMVSEEVPEASRKELQSMGVTVKQIEKIANVYAQHHPQFAGVFSKLLAFNQTQYEQVILMDSDILVLGDMSGLFGCGSFCAMFIDPCIFNSGIMVITPSHVMFNDLVNKIGKIDSYDNADQGYFNGYFSELYEAPLYNPEQGRSTHLFENARFDASTVRTWDTQNKEKFVQDYKKRIRRLPYRYHSDHKHLMYQGVFHPCKRPQAIEMLGAAKPWLWWTYPITDYSWKWFELRRKLPHYDKFWTESVLSGGVLFRLLFPPILVMLALRKFKMNNLRASASVSDLSLLDSDSEAHSNHNNNNNNYSSKDTKHPIRDSAVSFLSRRSFQILCVCVGLVVFYCSFKVGWNMTPLHLDPYVSWTIFGGWFTLTALSFSTVACYFIAFAIQRSTMLRHSVQLVQSRTYDSDDLSTVLINQAMATLPSTVQNWTVLVLSWGVFSVFFLSHMTQLMLVFIVGKLVCALLLTFVFVVLFLIGFYKVNRAWSLKRQR